MPRNRLKDHGLKLERLENRSLMAADIVLNGSVLSITGTSQADTVSVQEIGGWGESLRVSIRNEVGQLVRQSTFDMDSVQRLRIDVGQGNDSVYNYSSKPADIWGGEGWDYIVGGSAADQIWGGDQNDHIMGGSGNDTIDGGSGEDTIYGELGNDLIRGGMNADRIFGGAGVDNIFGDKGGDRIWGGFDSDYIYGGDDDDIVHGDDGHDQIFGDAGNDLLFGDSGWDGIWGGSGNDFLDAGSIFETAKGGEGTDFNAYITAVDGALITDIRQGDDVSCWVLAGLGSAVNSGVRLQDRISYLGEGVYRVQWLRPDGMGQMYQDVAFNGTVTNSDPRVFESPGATLADSWVVIYQRAILQQAGRSLTNTGSGGAYSEPQLYLGRNFEITTPISFDRIRQALNSNQAVMANIPSGNTVAAQNNLPDWHWYSVVAINGNVVTLYNPHGSFRFVSREVFATAFNSVSIV